MALWWQIAALNVQFWFMLQMAYLSEQDGFARR
jgi:hypothetical protein